jgi:uncharacterized membrane protein
MHRMTAWRQRLDVTSNWAILLTMGITTFALGSHTVPHFVLLLGLAIIAISIVMEARRYRHLHHSEWRLHLMDRGFYAPLLRREASAEGGRWREMLAADLEEPRLLISFFCAARVRLRRNYLLLVYFTTAVWLTKLFVHPASPASAEELYARLAVGRLIPPWFVAGSAAGFLLGSTVLALTCPTIEQLERWRPSRPGEDPFPLP